MTRDTLYFVHSTRPPDSDVRVFDSLTREFLGATFTFRVIGSSHYVSAPAYDFHELSSCDPVGGDEVTTLRLDGPTVAAATADSSTAASTGTATDPAADRRLCLEYAAEGLRCATLAERRPLAAFPAEEEFALSYRFEEDAVTTVDIGADGYETYHTYPEFDLALYTRTTFESVPDGRSVADAAADPVDTPGQPTD